MAYTDINPDVVADVAGDVASTLSSLNNDFGDFQGNVFSKLQEAWYNENAVKVMPGAVTEMKNVNNGINESLSSLGKALIAAANAWAEANGAAGYTIPGVVKAPVALSCDVQDNKDGFKGMDVEDVQQAIVNAESTKEQMISRLRKLEAAGEKQGFRGGNMQAQLNNVCHTLEGQIKSAIDKIIDSITSNSGIAKTNVESAKGTTESTFTIS